MVFKIEVMQIKERGFTDMFLICVMLKVILKASKQIFKFFFTIICHNLTPGIYRARKEKECMYTFKKNGTGLANELKFDDCPYIFL